MKLGRNATAGRRREDRHGRSPAALMLLTGDEWLHRSVEALLNHQRYQLTVFKHPRRLVRLLSDRRTDAVLLDLQMTPQGGRDLGEWLWETPRDPAIPIVGICSREGSPRARLEALNAGVWDVLDFPLPPAELLAKMDTWVGLKRHFDQVKMAVLVDVQTGHYSSSGVRRRLRELVSLAQRTDQALSCVLFGADPVPEGVAVGGRELGQAAADFADALHRQTRDSDIVGRLEPLRFAVLTPQTPPEGAVKMAERLTSWSVQRRLHDETPLTFSAGVAGVRGKSGSLYGKPDLLLAASQRALNAARGEGAAQVAVG